MKKKPEFDDAENRFDDSENGTVEDAIGEEAEVVYSLPHPVQLLHPIEFGGETVTQITIRDEPDVECMAHMPIGSSSVQKIGHMIPVLAHCSGDFTELIKKLKVKDFNACMEVVNSFL